MKKIVKSIALGAALLAAAGPAGAADIELNLYGASAQYTFWHSQGPSFLTTTQGCTGTTQAETADKKHGVTIGNNCTGGNRIIFRYSARASYDGPQAVANRFQVGIAPDCPGQPGFRKLADETTISGVTVGATKCVDVLLGASDVAGESFQQSSTGQLKGPLGGGNVAFSFNGVDTTGLTAYQPIVVPFGFFANNAVHVKKCAGGAHDGNLCTVATQTTDCDTGVCTEQVIDDISREMAVQIFSGQAPFWSNFGDSYTVAGATPGTDDFVVACLRHAGSGTAASLDWAVMNHGFWGAPLVAAESSFPPIVWFNESSTDEIKCVNGNSTANPTGAPIGAVGYADADQGTGVSGTSQNVAALKYNGVPSRRNTIRNGNYDFYSNQWLYENPVKTPNGSAQHALIVALDAFAGNPANLTLSSSLGNKARFWASKGEMEYNKVDDKSYPGFLGASLPQIP